MDKYTFLVSDESINCYGGKVLTSGISTTQFEKNPIMLYMHERPNVIGRWENLKIENDKLYADAVFDIADPKANEIAGKVERGFLKSASVGLSIIEKEGDTITKSELLEISIVDVGGNSNALRLYKGTQSEIMLKLNEIQAIETLSHFLGFKEDKKHSDIVELVKSKINENTVLKNELHSIHLANKEESEWLVDELIKMNKILPFMKDKYLQAMEEDFYKTRLELVELFPFKRLSLYDQISKSKILLGKNDWTLEDYRKKAPEELRQNPELFKSLIDKHYGIE
ncbi:HK97 family phage prohead protease [Flavobacterium oreochromis]|uniref:HK97 family phage prohead protease n=1 Tax=Flavobacterium oreochromis TaxID=2906078 RepID=UPI00385A8B08